MELDKSIYKYLLYLGVSPKLRGFFYSLDAVRLYAGSTRLYFKDIYADISKRRGTGIFCVERAIKNAIETAWLKTDLNVLHAEFGATVDGAKGRPTNKAFVAHVFQKVNYV
jgi:two-component system response regulator (stage 0 sporulation protein A)